MEQSVRDNKVAFSDKGYYIAGTEILTEEGWKMMNDLRFGDLLVQYNEGRFVSTTPVELVERVPYKGLLYEFTSEDGRNRCLVTPAMRMVYQFGKKLRSAKAINFKKEYKVVLPDVRIESASSVISQNLRAKSLHMNRNTYYEGNVYHIEGGNGVFITRFNGKTFIAGNYTKFLENDNI